MANNLRLGYQFIFSPLIYHSIKFQFDFFDHLIFTTKPRGIFLLRIYLYPSVIVSGSRKRDLMTQRKKFSFLSYQ